MDVRIFVTITGDKIMARLENAGEHYYEITQPIVLKEVMTPQGMGMIQVPFPCKHGQTVQLYDRALLCSPLTPPDDLYNMYVESTAHIAIPKANNSGLII